MIRAVFQKPGESMSFKERIKFIVLPMALTFAFLGAAEGFIHHHHEPTADHDCAYCGFHQATNQSDFSFPTMALIPLFSIFLAVLSFYVFYPSSSFIVASGRSPPKAVL
jgi:hypothetical protein